MWCPGNWQTSQLFRSERSVQRLSVCTHPKPSARAGWGEETLDRSARRCLPVALFYAPLISMVGASVAVVFALASLPHAARLHGPVLRVPSRCHAVAEVPMGEGHEVDQKPSIIFSDVRLFSQVAFVSGALALGSALQLMVTPAAPWVELMATWAFFSRVAAVLRSAAARGRLGATTFQLLNIGVVAGMVGDAVALASYGGLGRMAGAITSRALLLLPSARALRRHGPPRGAALLPFSVRDVPLARAYGIAATGEFVLAAVGVIRTLKTGRIPLSPLKVLPSAALLALRGAANVGPKRLSSGTYLALNSAVMAYGGVLGATCVMEALRSPSGRRLVAALASAAVYGVAVAAAAKGRALGRGPGDGDVTVVDVKVVG